MNNYHVNAITNTTYINCNTINSINLKNVSWVNNSMVNAFGNCTNLKRVTNVSSSVTNMHSTFFNCQNLTVSPTIPSGVTNMYATFYFCHNLTNAPVLPDSLTDMTFTFTFCNKLVEAPIIPNTITNMYSTFSACSNIINAPTIPNSVTNMHSTFSGCVNLVNAPTIPDSVADMSSTFSSCHKLVSSPNIPSSVVTVYNIYSDCYNLTGNINIYSNKITNAINAFRNNTGLTKNIYIPFRNSDGTMSATYNAFDNAGYNQQGGALGIYLKTLTPVVTINATPADATIAFDNLDYIYKNSTSIIVNRSEQVSYTVSKTGYASATNIMAAGDDEIINVELTKENYTLTVNTTPADATVTFSTGTVSGHDCTVPYNTTVTYTISKSGYITSDPYVYTVTQDDSVTAPALDPEITYYAYKRDPSFIQWSSTTNPQVNSTVYGWGSGTYGGGKWIFIGSNNDNLHCYVTSSTDGDTWTTPALISNFDSIRPVSSVVYYQGKYYAFATKLVSSTRKTFVSTSVDGIIWDNPVAYDTSVICGYEATTNNNQIVVISGNKCSTFDGTNWNTFTTDLATPSTGGAMSYIAYNGSKYIAWNGRGYIATSTDLEHWTTPASKLPDTGSFDWSCIFNVAGTFVALRGSFNGAAQMVAYSTDGNTWTTQTGVLPTVRTLYLIHGYNGAGKIKLAPWNPTSTNYLFTGILAKYDEIYVQSLDGTSVIGTTCYLKEGNTFVQAAADNASLIATQDPNYILVQDGSKYLRDSASDETA